MATIYKQANQKWAKKPYKNKCTVGGSGCGLVAVTNLLNEYEEYKSATPLTFYSYMRQFAVDGDGTKRAGVATALAHYGLKDVRRFQSLPISQAWTYLAKGYRGVFVMSSKAAGSKKIKWTTSGHYVAITDYKVKNGKHYLYVKDSSWRNHDGWLTYEEHMKGAVSDCIIGDCSALLKQSTNTSTDEKKAPQTAVNGLWDKETTLLLQKKFGTPQDGVVSGQNTANKKYHAACLSESWKYGKGGSTLIWTMQEALGLYEPDGQCGVNTIKALQVALGVTVDGYLGKQTATAIQKLARGEVELNPKGTKIANMAIKCAYASESASAKYPSGKIKADYKTALNKAYPKRTSWGKPPRDGASCDVFVGTCIVASGVDANFPRGLQPQYKYLKSSDKWKLVTESPKATELVNGDIIIYCSSGSDPTHIMLWGGGKLRHAHYNKWFGRTTTDIASRLKGKKWIKVYRAK